MTWARLDDSIVDHPKVLETPLAALGLFTLGLAYAARHLTDGRLSAAAVRQLARGDESLPAALVRSGLWEAERGAETAETGHEPVAFRIHDFLDYNLSAADARTVRKAAKERMKRFRMRSREQTPNERGTNAFVPDGTGREDLRKKRGSRGKRNPRVYTQEFEAFWTSYPPRDGRRDGKAEAFDEWNLLAPDAALQATMRAALVRYRVEKPVDACRWLKKRRWEDETGVRPPSAPRGPAVNLELERIAARERELGIRT